VIEIVVDGFASTHTTGDITEQSFCSRFGVLYLVFKSGVGDRDVVHPPAPSSRPAAGSVLREAQTHVSTP
jgi:hypothetical protein